MSSGWSRRRSKPPSLLDALKALGEELRVAFVKLDLVLSSGAGFKADGVAYDKRDSLSFGLADALPSAVAAVVAVQHSFCRTVPLLTRRAVEAPAHKSDTDFRSNQLFRPPAPTNWAQEVVGNHCFQRQTPALRSLGLRSSNIRPRRDQWYGGR